MDIRQLREGNRLFTTAADKTLLKTLAENGQRPGAAVVACADSRVPVEVIFNQTAPGTLFVIRVAGNIVADAAVRGSVEYVVTHLNVPILIILGHTDCGAVKARLKGLPPGEIGELLRHIDIKAATLEEAILENLALQVQRTLVMPCVDRGVKEGSLEVFGMLYRLATGDVAVISRNGEPVRDI